MHTRTRKGRPAVLLAHTQSPRHCLWRVGKTARGLSLNLEPSSPSLRRKHCYGPLQGRPMIPCHHRYARATAGCVWHFSGYGVGLSRLSTVPVQSVPCRAGYSRLYGRMICGATGVCRISPVRRTCQEYRFAERRITYMGVYRTQCHVKKGTNLWHEDEGH